MKGNGSRKGVGGTLQKDIYKPFLEYCSILWLVSSYKLVPYLRVCKQHNHVPLSKYKFSHLLPGKKY